MHTLHPYIKKDFLFPHLNGISAKTMDTHIKLYEGYVNSFNTIQEEIIHLQQENGSQLVIAELNRRKGFEFNGIRNHELFFDQLIHKNPLSHDTKLHSLIISSFGSQESFISSFTSIALTRGVGWTILFFDDETKKLNTFWVEEQHIGQPITLAPIILLDMWEHAYIMDYSPSEKKEYIKSFFDNLDWSVCASRLDNHTI